MAGLTVQRVAAMAMASLVAVSVGCGADDDRASSPTSIAEKALTQEVTREPRVSRPACATPTGQEKAAVRFAVRSKGRELRDEPWSIASKGRRHYIAAEIDSVGPRLIVLITYADDAKYLSGMRAVNGTARTFTDLPPAGDRMPVAATKALDCLDL